MVARKSSRSPRPAPAAASRRAPRPGGGHEPAPALALRHPALLVAALVAALCVVVSVSYRIYDSDFWQHLLVGRAIWELKGVPDRQIWTWPTYGSYEVTWSWLFRALLWPFWNAWGVTGAFAWRWITTLAAFGALWAAARRMGARGFLPFVIVAWCALIYSQRSQPRPETLVAVLLAVQLWIHEARRNGGPDRTALLPLVALLWANAHISYWMGIAFQLVYAAEAWWSARGAKLRWPVARLLGVVAASVAVSFLNPAGWHALSQPFEYWLIWRHEPIYQLIRELKPIYWGEHSRNGLPLLLALWPLLLAWRWRKRGFDLAESSLCALYVALALSTQRFLGFLVLVAVPFVSRDLEAWVGARAWPRWTRGAWARAGLAAATAVAIGIPEWSGRPLALGVGLESQWFPVAACDFMRDHGVRGRGFNHFYLGGYLLWRFWPERDRLPFMDIHQTGTREDRRLAALTPTRREAWAELDRKYGFDWVMLNRYRPGNDRSLDILDADPAFALVFMDDNAALYVRRLGPLRAVADSFAYRTLGAGDAFLARMGSRANRDSAYRDSIAVEFRRMAAGSPFSASAHDMLARVASAERRWDVAGAELEAGLAIDPYLREGHERMGLVALALGRPREALDYFRRARRESGREERVERGIRGAEAALHALESRRREVEDELRREPGSGPLADTLRAIEERLRPMKPR